MGSDDGVPTVTPMIKSAKGEKRKKNELTQLELHAIGIAYLPIVGSLYVYTQNSRHGESFYFIPKILPNFFEG